MTQYEVKLPRELDHQAPMSLTLSRPLAKNQLLLVGPNNAIMIPVYCLTEEGELNEGFPFPPESVARGADIISYVWIDYKTKQISAYWGHPVYPM